MPFLGPAATSLSRAGTGIRTTLGVLPPATPGPAFASICEYSSPTSACCAYVNCGADAACTGARYTDADADPVVAARTRFLTRRRGEQSHAQAQADPHQQPPVPPRARHMHPVPRDAPCRVHVHQETHTVPSFVLSGMSPQVNKSRAYFSTPTLNPGGNPYPRYPRSTVDKCWAHLAALWT
jgi:hypothetical protein